MITSWKVEASWALGQHQFSNEPANAEQWYGLTTSRHLRHSRRNGDRISHADRPVCSSDCSIRPADNVPRPRPESAI